MNHKDPFNLINTSIVNSEFDVFWDKQPLTLKSLSTKPFLFITTPHLKNEEKDLVTKIIAACQLTEDQYNWLELNDEESLAWHHLRDELKISTIVLFGISPQQLGVSAQFMPHQTNRFDNCNWIPTGTPAQMISQPEIKAHLWKYGLKPVFIDKIYS